MDRPLALRAEVVDRRAEAGAEELLPEPVDEDAGGQRVFRGDDPARQIEPGEPRSVVGRGGWAGNAGTAGTTIGPASSCQLPRGRMRTVTGGTASTVMTGVLPARHWRTRSSSLAICRTRRRSTPMPAGTRRFTIGLVAALVGRASLPALRSWSGASDPRLRTATPTRAHRAAGLLTDGHSQNIAFMDVDRSERQPDTRQRRVATVGSIFQPLENSDDLGTATILRTARSASASLKAIGSGFGAPLRRIAACTRSIAALMPGLRIVVSAAFAGSSSTRIAADLPGRWAQLEFIVGDRLCSHRNAAVVVNLGLGFRTGRTPRPSSRRSFPSHAAARACCRRPRPATPSRPDSTSGTLTRTCATIPSASALRRAELPPRPPSISALSALDPTQQSGAVDHDLRAGTGNRCCSRGGRDSACSRNRRRRPTASRRRKRRRASRNLAGRERVELVVVALAAAERRAEPGRTDGAHAVGRVTWRDTPSAWAPPSRVIMFRRLKQVAARCSARRVGAAGRRQAARS